MKKKQVGTMVAVWGVLVALSLSYRIHATDQSTTSSTVASSVQQSSRAASSTSTSSISSTLPSSTFSSISTSSTLASDVVSSSIEETLPSSSQVVEESVTETTPSLSDVEEVSPERIQSQPRLEVIVGKDDQHKIHQTMVFPYRTVVYLEAVYDEMVFSSTGVLIAPDLVLTAAHNIYDKELGQWADKVYAAPGQSGSTFPYGIYISEQYDMLRAYRLSDNKKEGYYDIAVLRLSEAVPASVGYLAMTTSLSPGDRVQIPGYPSYTEHKRMDLYSAFGTVSDVESILLGYSLDTEPGNSGSPILNQKNQVVGIHTSGISFKDNPLYGTRNIGRRIDKQIMDMVARAKQRRGADLTFTNNIESTTGNTYRLYHPGIRRHLYTQSLDESAVLSGRGWNFEGLKFQASISGTPVYRLYHEGTKEHLYTTSHHERDVLKKRDWRYEGIAWYSSGKKPIYRLYHKGLKVHLYTADTNEKNVLSKRGWTYEGVAFHVIR